MCPSNYWPNIKVNILAILQWTGTANATVVNYTNVVGTKRVIK